MINRIKLSDEVILDTYLQNDDDFICVLQNGKEINSISVLPNNIFD